MSWDNNRSPPQYATFANLVVVGATALGGLIGLATYFISSRDENKAEKQSEQRPRSYRVQREYDTDSESDDGGYIYYGKKMLSY